MPTSPERQASLSFEAEAPVSPPHRLSAWSPEYWPVAAGWHPLLAQFLSTDAARELGQFLGERLAAGAIIYPLQPLQALALTALAQVKVVILGQDPYHGPGQAHGLAFSVAPGVKPPPSLRNIFKEVARDPLLGPGPITAPVDGSLLRWAQQGVLLLNTCLTVEAGQPASHSRRGWEVLTDAIVTAVARTAQPVVFLLWGAQAQAKQGLIAASRSMVGQASADHLLLAANHPSPLSALRLPQPFLGCGHFGLTNAFLQQHGCAPIVW